MKQSNIRKCRKLANYLLNVKEDDFSMDSFFMLRNSIGIATESIYRPKDTSKHECGFTACVAGHASKCFPGLAKQSESYRALMMKITGVSFDRPIQSDSSDRNAFYHTLISDRWVQFDDTPASAAKRLLFWLDTGALCEYLIDDPMDYQAAANKHFDDNYEVVYK